MLILPLRLAASRFGGWWLSITTLYMASGGACPCCGATACPVGGASVGLLGALAFAWCRFTKRTPVRDDDEETDEGFEKRFENESEARAAIAR